MLASCQVVSKRTDGEIPILNNDKNLVLSACETSLSRGVEVCTFNRGSSIKSSVKMFVPFEEGSSGSAVIRFEDKFLIKKISSSQIEFSYSELLGDSTWKDEHDGIIQVVIFIENNGEVFRALGYVYLVIVSENYTPFPLFWSDVKKVASCDIYYNKQGKGAINCR